MYLITGANGQLGSELKDILGDEVAIYTDKDDLDITNQKEVCEFVQGKNIEYIINCAAYTAVDNAENEKSLARKINVIGAKNLSISAENIFFSSSFFFLASIFYLKRKHWFHLNPNLARYPSFQA